MTEKRFEVETKRGYGYVIGIKDNQKNKIYDDYILCDLLNDLSEENEYLKRQMGKQMEEIECLTEENEDFKKRIELCIDYNKALKKCVNEVEEFFEKHEMDTVNFALIDEVFDSCDFFYEEKEKLEKGNDELKQTIINLIENGLKELFDDKYRIIEDLE